ncbi:hypothetical protein M9Y10_029202 [Tritrichomonas musculus]|uniref:Uncharacterized protein n=1 Tax=Tritrichomonas musculus TaxID=1915356 RepID=A0ABR2KPR8_9EUKA
MSEASAPQNPFTEALAPQNISPAVPYTNNPFPQNPPTDSPYTNNPSPQNPPTEMPAPQNPIDEMLKKIENITDSTGDIEKEINELKGRMGKNIDDLIKDDVDLTDKLLVLQKMCLFYEDICNSKRQPQNYPINCSLMSAAYNDLSEPANDYNHFVGFISRHKGRIFTENGSYEYIQRLQKKIKILDRYYLSS